MKKLVQVVFVAVIITAGLQGLLRKLATVKQDAVAVEVCNLIENTAQVGDTRGALDQAIHFFHLQDAGVGARASLADQNSSFSTELSSPTYREFRDRPCEITVLLIAIAGFITESLM